MLVLIEGFGLGLSTGIYCLGACAPILIPFVMVESRPNWRSNLWLTGQFLLGRLIAYVLFAAGASLLGQLASSRLPTWLVPAGLLLSGILMLAYAAAPREAWPGLCPAVCRRFPAARMPLLLGFLVGINVCPPFLAAMTRVIDLHHTGLSILYFLAFFVGTTLYVLPVILVTPIARIARLKSIGWLACVIAGTWFCASGISGLVH
ncbi:MAG: sulfite exporter TauE/SafE family protein [Planctomycetes bacterium]|nr:sulfite exporter TauE/SafE family protein [Planctomycetota bacterium]